jgi:hypothetical protein
MVFLRKIGCSKLFFSIFFCEQIQLFLALFPIGKKGWIIPFYRVKHPVSRMLDPFVMSMGWMFLKMYLMRRDGFKHLIEIAYNYLNLIDVFG